MPAASVAKSVSSRLPSPVARQLEIAEGAVRLLTRAGILVMGVQLDAFVQRPTVFVLECDGTKRMFPQAMRTVERRDDGTTDVFWVASLGNCRVQWRR